ncbi:MAG: hypothetical protein KAQ73_06340 [Dehalococcoidia bacterium]|nr:hypothetical protein [Dehalococcoidia bacterium]
MKTRRNPGWLDKFKLGAKRALGMNMFICESCKWNWRSACHRPERPNATWCPDYTKKGK